MSLVRKWNPALSEGRFPFLHTTRHRGPRLLRGEVGAGRLRISNVFLVGWFATQLMSNRQVILKTLLLRLPDRCAFCHRRWLCYTRPLVWRSVYLRRSATDKFFCPTRSTQGDDV